MSEMMQYLDSLHRPRLLVRAARAGATRYNRSRHLGSLLGAVPPASQAARLSTLIMREAEIEGVRQSGCATYSVTKHVYILTALMAEARMAKAEAGDLPEGVTSMTERNGTVANATRTAA